MSDDPRAGLFVTLEGGEGVGKSTLVRNLSAALSRDGREVVATREPGGSPLGERIRDLLLSGAFKANGAAVEAVAFAAARSDHVSKTIRPALERGAVVLCDRFFDSTRAYQGHHGVGPELLDALEAEAVGRCRPDLTILLDCDPAVGLARAAARRGAGSADRFEDERLAFHEGVRASFLAMAAREPGRFLILDASAPSETIAAAASSEVTRRIMERSGAPAAERAAGPAIRGTEGGEAYLAKGDTVVILAHEEHAGRIATVFRTPHSGDDRVVVTLGDGKSLETRSGTLGPGWREAMRSQVAAVVETLREAAGTIRTLTVEDVIESNEQAISASGLNPWCMNEGLSVGGEAIPTHWLDSALERAEALNISPKGDIPEDSYDTLGCLADATMRAGALLTIPGTAKARRLGKACIEAAKATASLRGDIAHRIVGPTAPRVP